MKIKQNIFKWHRILGIITLIPVLFWSLSGIMHPFKAHWFKPDIANTYYPPAIIDTVDLKSLKQTLEVNGIKQFTNVRIVKYDKQQYFQLEDQPNHFRYLNCSSGKELHNGDKKYATHLARYFLQDSTSKIASIQKITAFSQEYKYINRLLPVWKVSFARKDKMDVYLETQHNRLGTYNTSSRKIFIALFNTFHNWSFLDKIANNEIRIFVMLILLTVISLSALSGLIIYGLF